MKDETSELPPIDDELLAEARLLRVNKILQKRIRNVSVDVDEAETFIFELEDVLHDLELDPEFKLKMIDRMHDLAQSIAYQSKQYELKRIHNMLKKQRRADGKPLYKPSDENNIFKK